jgi:hypothetical protein
VSHSYPAVPGPVVKQGFPTVVGRKKGAASYSVFRSNAKGQSWRGQLSTAILRPFAAA